MCFLQGEISSVDFVKSKKAKDQYDADISSSEPTMLLIAIGSLAKRTRRRINMDANFHSAENESIIFNSEVIRICVASNNLLLCRPKKGVMRHQVRNQIQKKDGGFL